jgi:hypothetical protein
MSGAGDMARVEHLPHKLETLGSNANPENQYKEIQEN